MTAKIVVGTDGSAASGSAVQWAVDLARSSGASLQVVTTWHYPAFVFTAMGAGFPVPPAVEMQQEAEASVAAFMETLDIADGVAIDLTAVEGDAANVLCDLSADADLLVVGSRGLGGFKGLLLGSVGAYCANHAACPVALIPEDWNDMARRGGSVVVGVDGSDNAHKAVDWADQWAPEGATLALVSVWNFPLAYDSSLLVIDDAVLQKRCEDQVAEAAARVERHEVTTTCERGDARNVLGTHAARAAALVLGARGHSGLDRLLLGSVASTMAHHLNAPTVIVR